ncbi:MAG: adenylate/guanylate cyclase domain-containing protein [Casimicrobiaceae bacterium]
MSESPVLTFLFTDIEGSTSKWDEQPEQMAQAVGRHDALLRDLVQLHKGRIVKTTGDGIYAAFESPVDGVAAVVDIQLAFLDPGATAGMGLRVRCGLHSGPVQSRDNDYFGSTINRTARIMNAAHGGQIVVSAAIAEQARDRLPPEVSLKDLGTVRLKGLATSEAVFQVVHPKLYQNFPALRELEATPNNLPQQLTSFIGREREREEIEEMLGGTRLLTLLGMGGLGKTRLSLQVGTSMMDAYPDGVWFIDLQTVRDDALVASETARVLGVREEPGRPLLQTLCAHLKTRKLMLIIDNCEQVIEVCADVANAILRSAPEVRIIATSRIALRVPGEQTYVVQPLPVPMRNADAETLAKSTSVQLFVQRAKLHKPSFDLTEKEAPAVAELVYRLEGIPLAIELAAARVRSLSVADINKRLNDRYKILTGGDRTLQARQQTLRALIDWSYDLLEDNEQILLARLSVFAGGFELPAIEAICGTDPLDVADVLDIITSLVEKSLLRVEDGEDGARYRMLETIRDYAREKLLMRDEQIATGVAHANYFLTVARSGNQGLDGPDEALWMRRLEDALDDLRAAISLALNGGADPVLSVRFEAALMGFWLLRGYVSEGRGYVRASLALPGVRESDSAYGHALYVGAALADSQGFHSEAQQLLDECLALRRKMDHKFDLACTLSTRALVMLHAGRAAEAREDESEAVDLFRQTEHRFGEAMSLLHLGQIEAYEGNNASAREHLEQAVSLAREIDYGEVEGEGELLLGQVAFNSDDLAEAVARFERSLQVCLAAEERRGQATASWWLGKTDLARQDLDSARVRLTGAMRTFHSLEMFVELTGCLEDYGELLAAVGSADTGAQFIGVAASLRERLALPRSPQDEQRWHRAVARARESIGVPAFDAAVAKGRAWPTGDAVQRALAGEEKELMPA